MLPPNCYYFIKLFFFSIHPTFRFSVRPSLPSPLWSSKISIFFAGWNSWWGSSGAKWICRQVCVVFTLYYPAVRFVLCSYCTTSSVMSAEQVVIGVRHFQVDIFSVPERRKKRDKDETLATLHFFFSECLKRVYFCEVYWFGSPLVLCNIDERAFFGSLLSVFAWRWLIIVTIKCSSYYRRKHASKPCYSCQLHASCRWLRLTLCIIFQCVRV